MEVVKDFKNSLLNRREVEAVMESDGNPGFSGVSKAIVDELKADESLIVVKNVYSNFGSNEFTISAFVYGSIEDKEKVEGKVEVVEEEKKEEAPAVEAPAPAPAEGESKEGGSE